MSAAPKHRVIAAGFRAIAATRADRWLAPLARGRGAILMFHHVRPASDASFQPNALLEISPDFLDTTLTVARRMGFDLVSLDEVPDRLLSGGPRPFLALTFDDGYRDNVTYAQPILRRHGAPWTMFVTRDFASGTGRLWWLELEHAIAALDRVRAVVDGREISLPSITAAEKQAAFDRLYTALRAGPEDVLLGTIAGLADRAGLDRDALVRGLCLGWDEIGILARDPAVTIGAHTLSHPMLAKHPAAVAKHEIEASRRKIEHRLGRPVRHFAYPVGDPGSAARREFALAERAGFATAVTTRPGHLFAAHAGHRHALPRVSVNGLHQSEAAIGALLSGVPFLLWNRGRRLAVG